MDNLLKYARLADTNSVGASTVKKIIEHFRSIENLDFGELGRVVGKKRARLIEASMSSPRKWEKELVRLVERGEVKFTTLEDDNYPRILKEVSDPPPILFYVGEKPSEGTGVVGTRRPSEKSLKFVEEVVRRENKTVISGGAKGIDYRAHLSALEMGLPTVVVLGSGILKMEGRIKSLLERYDKVSVVSEFLPWKEASRYTFPKRNRIIAGLSNRLYVIEAGKRSGALITASYAKKYRREIYVYVGQEDSERWEGCRKLIEEGVAKRVEGFSSYEEGVMGFLSRPRTLDEVVSYLGISSQEALSLLSRLILEGKVLQEGAYYVKG